MSNNFARERVDEAAYQRAVDHLRGAEVRLPKISELAQPSTIPTAHTEALAGIDPDRPDAGNLYRVHWFNGADRQSRVDVPEHVVLPTELTCVEAKIIVALGNRFPMIRAHKVLAAYGCLVPRLLTGQFDPARHRAVWPSTGDYCRGGIAISRILGCRGVAVLPEGMRRERFEWLDRWVSDDNDIVRTPGTESNVKEIYDACHRLAEDPDNVILNQFSEFGNYVVHRAVTGPALETLFRHVKGDTPLRARAFVAASGSAGTLAAGDYLKQVLHTDTAVVEALECPTLLYNGYGEHNIQGIGDKHLPLIHNVLGNEIVIGVSDRSSDTLNELFNTPVGRRFLADRHQLDQQQLSSLADLGLSSIANVIAAIKLAKHLGLGSNDAVMTVATDGAEMYGTELAKASGRRAPAVYDEVDAAQSFGEHILGIKTDHVLELDTRSHVRVFNLGYYTWVEQQGVSVEAFDARRDPAFWDDLMQMVDVWDGMIDTFNNH